MSVFSCLSPDDKAQFWASLALRHAKGIGALRAKSLVSAYGSPLAAVQAGLAKSSAWREEGLGIPVAVAQNFAAEHWRQGAKAEWESFKNSSYSVLLYTSPSYPALLRDLPDAPLLLYYQGDISLLRAPAVGVVGSRSCTREAVAVAAFFSKSLSQAGVVIISGMARGVDRAAHLAALDGPGSTIAVLGTGLDVIYPLCNQDLVGLLRQKGLVVSEFALGTRASPSNFPVRNRIISGLSQGVLVVEAAGRSGSLITARHALEQGREVFAVPGPTLASASAGCRELIRTGAKPVFCADDILFELAPLLSAQVRDRLAQDGGKDPHISLGEDPLREAWLPEQSHLDLSSFQGNLPLVAPEARQQPTHRTGFVQAPYREEKDTRSDDKKIPFNTDMVLKGLQGDALLVATSLLDGPQHIDVICRKTTLDIAKVSAVLLALELDKKLLRQPGMVYTLVRRESI